MREHLVGGDIVRLRLIVAGLRDRMGQRRLRMCAKGRKSVLGGKGKPAHQLGAQLQLRRIEDDQVMTIRLVRGRVVSCVASIRVR